MKKFTQVHLTTMRIIMLIVGILFSIFTGIFLLESLGVGLIMYGYGAGGFGFLPFFIALLELPFTILSFIASRKFKKAKRCTDEELYARKGSLLGWGIVSSIITLAIFGMGTYVVLPLVIVNHVFLVNLEKKAKQSNQQPEAEKVGVATEVVVEEPKEKVDERTFGEKVKSGATNVVDGTKDVLGIKTPAEKLKEQLLALKSLKDEGLITEEEYEAKKKKILGI